jgi:hypothetical protein
VTARRQIAELLLKDPDLVKKSGLKAEDLLIIATEGRKAEEADAEQKEQLADRGVDRSGTSKKTKSLFERESELRDLIAAVVEDLKPEAPKQAEWLSRLSFARFRLRELAHPRSREGSDPISEEEAEEILSVQKVEVEDNTTRARNLGRYCNALLRRGREAIVEELAERDFSKEKLETLAADAVDIAEAGRNTIKAVEATQREAEAAGAQKHRWDAIRRLVRRAVKGNQELEKKFAEC